METVPQSLDFIDVHRGGFISNDDAELAKNLDGALDKVYKEGFSSAIALKEETKARNSKAKRKSQENWLLPGLVIENMESEQVWQQLELWNRKALPLSIDLLSWTLLRKNRDSEEESSGEELSDSESEVSDDDEKIDFSKIEKFETASSSSASSRGPEEEADSDEYMSDSGHSEQSKKVRFADETDFKSGKVSDQFFDMTEFEKFADEEIDAEGDEMIYSDYITETKNAKDDTAMYADFFEAGPAAKKSKTELSSLEKKQAIEARARERMEEENVGPKPWLLSGEVEARRRPQNSLLEHHVEFDHATRLAPIVTEDFSKSIEDIIKQRIIDKAWDDVERKIKPAADVGEFRRRAVLDSEKSKLSLAELYEKDYVDKQKGQVSVPSVGVDDDDKAAALKSEMRDLFFKLDALSHFQFTPKAPVPELRIVKNVPSAAMEEAAPVVVSDANLLAPAEVKRPISGELKSKDEQTDTDRKRARRRAKAHMRARQKTKVERLTQRAAAGDSKASKLLALEKLKTGSRVKIAKEETNKKAAKKSGKGEKSKQPVVRSAKSASEFFSRLQDEVDAQIHQRSNKKKKHQSSAQTAQ